MINSGNQLRSYRESLGLSQAGLAEITGLSQHILSAFELEKAGLEASLLEKILNCLNDKEALEKVANRKKRYRDHTYSQREHDPVRLKKYLRTSENPNYIEELKLLGYAQKAKFSGLSLFSGCGGLSLGFKSIGCEFKGFLEIDDNLSQIYQENFRGVPRIGSDISQVSNEEIKSFLKGAGNIDVIVGGPPCQGFSLSGKRNVDDPRNQLFKDYMRFINIIRPKVALMENVRLLTSMKLPNGNLAKTEILEHFSELGYKARIFEINALQYGVPQHRERVIFIAVRNDLNVEPSLPEADYGFSANSLPSTKPVRTFADACSDLAYLESGEKSHDPFHCAVSHPDHVIKWLWNVPEGSSAHDNQEPELRPPSGYNTTYKRQVWNEPAATVQTTFGMISGCRNVHPIATRSLTIREAARLQSFPDSYSFVGSLGNIRTGIGNAVPPLLARALAIHVRSCLLNLVKVSSL